MKKYFAKYLPVEGEIKDKALVFDNERKKVGHITYPDNADGFYDIEYLDGTNGGSDDFTLVKLSLCSRDIEIGDTFLFKLGYGDNQEKWCEFKLESETETHWNCSTNDPIIRQLGSTQSFHKDNLPLTDPNFIVKEIGVISPAAKWVKEGDEFLAEGKDCEVFPLHNHDSEGKIIYVDENGDRVDTPIYLIKCPSCGSFK